MRSGTPSRVWTAEESVYELCAKCVPYAANWAPSAEQLWSCSHGCAGCGEKQVVGK